MTVLRKSIIIALIAISTPVQSALSDDMPGFDRAAFISSLSSNKTLRIGMVDCIAMALKSNSEVLIRKMVPRIEDANVLIQRAKFEPDFTFDYLMEDNTDLSDTPLFGPNPTKVHTNDFNFGWDQKLVTGTDIAIDFLNKSTRSNYDSRFQAVNPMYDSVATLTVTQPLMKGFGITVNKADFLIAKNNKTKSVYGFTGDVINMLTSVKKSYYDFQYSQEQYKTAVISLGRVKDLYAINKEKYAKGLASNVDLLQSESEVYRFEEAVAGAEGVMKLAEDNLKFITNIVDDAELWNANIELLDPISYEKFEPDIMASLDRAFENRPDYQAAKLDLKNRDISVIYYRNGMLPIVDLIGSYGFNGLAKTYGKDLGHMGSGKYEDWTIGVSVTLPMGSEEEKGKYEKSKLEKKQALIAFKRLEQKIILEVRNAVRDINIEYRVLEASQKTKEAEIQNYEAQSTRFRAGLVSTHDIVDYQEKLARAEVNYAKSVIEYNTALIELAKVEGMTLLYENIAVEY